MLQESPRTRYISLDNKRLNILELIWGDYCLSSKSISLYMLFSCLRQWWLNNEKLLKKCSPILGTYVSDCFQFDMHARNVQWTRSWPFVPFYKRWGIGWNKIPPLYVKLDCQEDHKYPFILTSKAGNYLLWLTFPLKVCERMILDREFGRFVVQNTDRTEPKGVYMLWFCCTCENILFHHANFCGFH